MMACLLFTITMTIGESEGVRTWWREDARSRGRSWVLGDKGGRSWGSRRDLAVSGTRTRLSPG